MNLTEDEVRAIARVLNTADGECHVCARKLAEEMEIIDPDHDWVAIASEERAR